MSGLSTGDMPRGQHFVLVVVVTSDLSRSNRTRPSAPANASVTEALDAPRWATSRNRGLRSAVVSATSVTTGGPAQISSTRNEPNSSTMTSATERTSRVTPGWCLFWPGATRYDASLVANRAVPSSAVRTGCR